MTITGFRIFDHSLATTREWLKDVQDELGLADMEQASEVTRAVLHTLRGRLPVNETANFAAQLPPLLQGVYYHDWTPTDKPVKMRSGEEFLGLISERLMGKKRAEDAARAVFRVVADRMTGGEVSDIKNILPGTIRELWPE